MFYQLVTKKAQWRNKSAPHHHQRAGSYSLAKTYLAAMLARKASSMGRSQEAQELSSSATPGTEPQDFGPRSLVPVRSSSASSPVQTNQYTATFSSWSDLHTRGWKHCIYLSCTKTLCIFCLFLNCSPMCVFTYVVFLQHFPGITWVSNILKVFCRVLTGIFYQNLLTPRMLGNDILITFRFLRSDGGHTVDMISANIFMTHLVKELGDIVDLVVYNSPDWFVRPPPYVVLLYFLQPKHLHLASHPQLAWSLWNKKLLDGCHVWAAQAPAPLILRHGSRRVLHFGRILRCTLNFGSNIVLYLLS